MQQLPRFLTACLLTLAVHLLTYFSGAIPFFDFRLFDMATGHNEAPFSPAANATVVVEIDEKSLQYLGQWPWPRIVLAKGLEEILRQQPAAVGFDILFPEPDRTSPVQIRAFYQQLLGLEIELNGFPQGLEDHDLIFSEVLGSGPTVLPLFALPSQSGKAACEVSRDPFPPAPTGANLPRSPQLICNTPVLQQSAAGLGYINAAVDNDGVFRRQPLVIQYQDRIVPNLVLAMLAQIDPDWHISAPQGSWEPLKISFAGKTLHANRQGEMLNPLYSRDSFRRISLAQVVAGEVPENLFTGKMVLVGASAAGLYDQYMSSSGRVLPGVFVHAAMLENIFSGNSYYQPENSKNVALGLSCLFSLAVVWLVFRRHYLLSWGVYLIVSSGSLLLTWLLLGRGVYVSLGYFLVPFSFLFFIVSLFFAVLHYVERKRFLEDLGAAHSATIDSMTMVAESRDVETGAHIVRTKEYVRLLAEALRHKGYCRAYLTPHIIDLIYRAAPLHDIGKVGIPDVILQKSGPLDADEIEIMHNHVTIGRTIIENAISSYSRTNEFLTIAANISYCHHEKWDGTGYPLGLKADDIPIEGRLMALADVYDALISRRCYKQPFSFQEAEQIIGKESGKHFDPVVVQAFWELRHAFRQVAQKNQETSEFEPRYLYET